MREDVLLQVKNIVKYFPVGRGMFISKKSKFVRAVDGVSFSIREGEILGLVGESGCGKTTIGHLILRLAEPIAGEIFFEGRDILKISREDMRVLRRKMQIIFQDPYSSLNPRMTVGNIVGEPLQTHGVVKGKSKEKKVKELLEVVGLDPLYAMRYPHEFSGGQRQRIGIARAIALNPRLIICDEPVSALDVSIQAQIINLLKTLQKELDLTFLFISHDLSVVKHISDVVAVMYLGKIVEMADKKQLYDRPLHPYTRALLSAIPIPNPKIKRRGEIVSGDVPSPLNPPAGCRFHTRCPEAKEICKRAEPSLTDVGESHFVSCHLNKEVSLYEDSHFS